MGWGSGIWDPWSAIRDPGPGKKSIPDPGGQKSTGSRIRNTGNNDCQISPELVARLSIGRAPGHQVCLVEALHGVQHVVDGLALQVSEVPLSQDLPQLDGLVAGISVPNGLACSLRKKRAFTKTVGMSTWKTTDLTTENLQNDDDDWTVKL